MVLGSVWPTVHTNYNAEVKELTNKVTHWLKNFSHEIPVVEEEVIRRLLERYKNVVGSIIQQQKRGYVNRYLEMIAAGAKGTLVNFCQTNGTLSQQYVNSERLELAYGNRTFPHFLPGDKDPRARGFVAENFMMGLGPIATFSHAMGGREGLVDTASKTARVGYLNRKLMRAMEDIKIAADGTLRDGKYLVGFAYGGNGFRFFLD